MSMLGAKDNETRSYLEIVDALRRHGAGKEDMEALWRRLVFNILISNTDDHLRNHGFLYAGQEGWRLSPAYDLNPVPATSSRASSAPRSTRMTTPHRSLSPWRWREFELADAKAREITADVGKAVSKWRESHPQQLDEKRDRPHGVGVRAR